MFSCEFTEYVYQCVLKHYYAESYIQDATDGNVHEGSGDSRTPSLVVSSTSQPRPIERQSSSEEELHHHPSASLTASESFLVNQTTPLCSTGCTALPACRWEGLATLAQFWDTAQNVGMTNETTARVILNLPGIEIKVGLT